MKIVGNQDILRQMNIAAMSAKSGNRHIPHMLFAGAAGCGKTTMAKQLAKIAGTDFIRLLPDSIKKFSDVETLLDSLDHSGYDTKGNRAGIIRPAVIFIDEIHNLKILPQEWLGVAMENFALESKDGKYTWLPYFTLVGATTNDGLLSKPFLDRFKMRFIFKPYSFEESIEIVMVHSSRLDIAIMLPAAKAIARRGRGVPRIIVGYLERCRDTATVKGANVVTEDVVESTFALLGIDETGLRETELRLMKALYDAKMPVGVENLAIIINEVPKTIINSIEPYLIQRGLILRSGKGRILTEKGKEYLEERGYTGKKTKIKKEALEAGYVRR
jgi:Holliday junction DNA helicase RuvB